ELVMADLLAERLALVGVADRRVHTGLGEADRSRGDGVPALVDRAHRDEEAVALLADPMLLRDHHVVEVDQAGIAGPDAELAVQSPGREALHATFHEERRHALVLLRAVDRG